jgi:hypothetical protein
VQKIEFFSGVAMTWRLIVMALFMCASSFASTYTVYYDEGDEFEIGYGYKCSWNGSNYSVAGVDAYYGFLTKEVNGATFVGLAEVGDISYGAYTISFFFGEGESTYPPDGFEDIGEEEDPDEPEVVYDLYTYGIYLSSADPYYLFGYETYLVWDNSTYESLGYGSLNDGDIFSYSSSVQVEYDSTDPIPQRMEVILTTGADQQTQAHYFDFQDTGDLTESGGHVYHATCSWTETVDTTDWPYFPINPTNPPVALEPTDPSPEETGGDTSPEVALNYEDFRDAVESALDNRKISQEEFQTAMENALNAKSLDGENIQNAMSNALKENNITQEGMYNAMGAAIQANNLSASEIGSAVGSELDDRDLTADAIGQAVADSIGTNAYAGIGDNGETIEADGDDPLDLISTNNPMEGASSSIVRMSETMSDFIDSLPMPEFPTGMSKVTGVVLPLGGSTVALNWSDRSEWNELREFLVWMVSVIAFFGLCKIVRRGIA